MAAVLAALSATAVTVCVWRGWTLYYGDALAHLNIARRIVDSRTPGWEQFGTVWLPLPHLLMLPLVRSDWLWRTGLAGAIPSALCFILAGTLFFLAARRAFGSTAAGAAACLALALNPNVLYLEAIPMTEALALASLAGVLYFTVRFRQEQDLVSAAGAGVASAAGALSRYEAWFLIPFVALYFLVAAKRRRVAAAVLYAVVASLGPLAWLAHNQYYYSNALEFYNGPYSAKAIYERGHADGSRYPGDHVWGMAWLYFRTAVRVFAGKPLVWIGVAGAAATAARRVFWPLALLALVPAFYVLSIYSSGTEIFIPELWPNSYYNSRYALVAVPLLAFAAAGWVALAPARLRVWVAVGVVLAAVSPWLLYPRAEKWVCWKESQVNSDARRAWTQEAAQFLAGNFRTRDGVLAGFGDQTGVFLEAGIPLRRTLHDGNGVEWLASTIRPDVFLREEWALAISGDEVSRAMARAGRSGARYECVKLIASKGAPEIRIFRRVP